MVEKRPTRGKLIFRVLGYVVASVALVWLGWIGIQILQAIQNNQIRCYNISPPLTLFERDMLRSSSLECASRTCRVVTKLSNERGYMCIFPGDGISTDNPLSLNLDQEKPRAEQRPNGRFHYHISSHWLAA